MKHANPTVLIAEDNPDELFLIERAFTQVSPGTKLQLLSDGEEAIAYMMGEGKYRDRTKYPYPSFVLTDLKMPRADGFAVLEFLKKNPDWAIIPTVVLSASANEDDIKRSYILGASSYHVKPGTFAELQDLVRAIDAYWKKCEVPNIDSTGRRIATESKGRLGERYLDEPGLPLRW